MTLVPLVDEFGVPILGDDGMPIMVDVALNGKTHRMIRNEIIAWLASLNPPLTQINKPIEVRGVQLPENKLEASDGTVIDVSVTASQINKSERKSVQRTRTAQVVIRHRIVAETFTAREYEETMFDAMHADLEKRLLQYVSEDGESRAANVETPVLTEPQMYFQEGVLCAVVNVEILNFEPSTN